MKADAEQQERISKVDLASFDNAWYKPGSPVKRLAWYICNRLFIKTYFPFPQVFKRYLLIAFGARIGGGLVLKPDVNIKYPWFLEIGENVWIGEAVWIDNLAHVKIGNNVCLSQGAFLLTGNHDYKSQRFDLIIKPIIIEDGAWVGAKAIVCPGVTVASHSIISVGSVIGKDTYPDTIYKGNPAIAHKQRSIT